MQAVCVLLTGRTGAGKHTIGAAVVAELRRRGRAAMLVDREAVERHLTPGTAALVWLCAQLVESGVVALVAASAPRRDEREAMRASVSSLLEVFVDAPLELCAQRSGTTDASYEEPYAADLRVPTHDREPQASIAQVLSFLEEHGLAPPDPSGA